MKRSWRTGLCLTMVMACISMLLTGCWDRREINDVAFVLGSALDITDNGDFEVSVLIPLPGNMGGAVGGGGGGSQKPFTIKTTRGKTIKEAIDILQKSLPRWLYFGHRRVLVISDRLAQTVGLSPIVDAITRMPENRLTAFVAISKGSALDVLNADVRLERFSAESIREVLQSDSSIRVSLKDVTSSIVAVGEDAMLPYLQKKQTNLKGQEAEDIDVIGFALTHNGIMKAAAKDDASNGIRLLSNQFRPYRETIVDGNHAITIAVNTCKLKVKSVMIDGIARFDIQSDIQFSINEDSDLNRNYNDIGQRTHIEKLFEQKAENDIKKAIAMMQKSNSDVIGFGRYLNRAYPGKWKNEWKSQWETVFPKCDFTVKVDADLFRIGMNRENLAKKDKEDNG
ncbi:Ger(x)C family spore germination protein [Paenibacillus radicis (ex Gao et al. 2016)]|uniref:Spore germination protein YfkR n=1 Tax=Paenibacillus radicis (ex Gao et al. 2016) TaxID=1737354 RepID=A0A917GZC3_9BACL|nr:Ger(x)C family spore germination protein [Paenibacillus radicis (ex Gao et al. 2016)]GGG62372.1 putative spore germination protein YfkR [Paenibacillus radicis (ex Gao et al. 2016)]